MRIGLSASPYACLDLVDPVAEVAIAYRIKERLRDFYCHL